MKNIKVLGPGCSNCRTTMRLIEEVAAVQGAEVGIEKVEDIAEIVSYGVMSTPGVIIDGELVHAGGIPSKEIITSWF
jgi:small redox-active disulfide protein 2